eukprot:TRINITY_DN4382_c0_g1_i5.p1 TRINITY_DN4382_c0_g1~~TRINITY_DN4382_c0_g1_i5.p1  ORF type:complete len:375 (-),score=31.57 TRINITY_DN4382_c0_g1_i5:4-1128(-)
MGTHPEEALQWYLQAATAGDAAAQYLVGRMYWARQQHQLAIAWWRKSHRQGHSKATHQLNTLRQLCTPHATNESRPTHHTRPPHSTDPPDRLDFSAASLASKRAHRLSYGPQFSTSEADPNTLSDSHPLRLSYNQSLVFQPSTNPSSFTSTPAFTPTSHTPTPAFTPTSHTLTPAFTPTSHTPTPPFTTTSISSFHDLVNYSDGMHANQLESQSAHRMSSPYLMEEYGQRAGHWSPAKSIESEPISPGLEDRFANKTPTDHVELFRDSPVKLGAVSAPNAVETERSTPPPPASRMLRDLFEVLWARNIPNRLKQLDDIVDLFGQADIYEERDLVDLHLFQYQQICDLHSRSPLPAGLWGILHDTYFAKFTSSEM